MTSIPQDTDVFGGSDPGISVTDNGQTWTIGKSVLVASNGVGFFSGFSGTSLINQGSILSGSATDAGVVLNGAKSFVSNLAGAKIIGANNGVVVAGLTATINNLGLIQGLISDGVRFDLASDEVSLTNRGSIFGRNSGVHADSNFDGGVIHNFGQIASDGDGIFVITHPGLTTFITNVVGGTIRGSLAAINVNLGNISLNNHGTLIGEIDAGFERDVIVNRGAIKGAVFLGAGNDLFNGTGGTSGAVNGEDGNDTLIGGSHADALFGDFGNDRLTGAAGNDKLHGGFGADTLIGGTGSDRFFFDSDLDNKVNIDKITDFAANVDKIILDRSDFTSIPGVGALFAARFHVGASAADQSDRIIYNQNTGFLFFDVDGKGGAAQVHFATVAPHLALHNTDFIVVA